MVRYGSLSGRRGRLPSKTKLLHSDDPPSPPLPLLTIINRAFADSRSTTASYTFVRILNFFHEINYFNGFHRQFE